MILSELKRFLPPLAQEDAAVVVRLDPRRVVRVVLTRRPSRP
jgi:hypothetical protein